MTIKRITASLLVAGACAGGWAAVAAGDDASSPPAAGGTTAAPAATAPAAPDPAQAFAVFRRPAGADDVMPAVARTAIATVANREGVSMDAARAVAASGAGLVWAIPGPDKVCLAIPDPVDGYGINCADVAKAQAGGLWVSLVALPGQKVGDARVAEFVPDGIDSVTATSLHGAKRAVPVSGNVAFTDVSDSASLGFTDAAGSHSVAIAGTPAALVSDEK